MQPIKFDSPANLIIVNRFGRERITSCPYQWHKLLFNTAIFTYFEDLAYLITSVHIEIVMNNRGA